MRTVTGNIKILANQSYSNRDIVFTLCDKYGNKINVTDLQGQIAIEQTIATDTNGNFLVQLYETETSEIPMFYKMSFVDNVDIADIKLFVQKGDVEIDYLKLLRPMPNLEMFYEIKSGKYEFKENTVDIFNKFFVNGNIFLNNGKEKQ